MSKESSASQLTVPEPLVFDQALWRRRSVKDILARYLVGAGGIGVIGSIILIFLFLFMVVFPLFKGAAMQAVTNYPLSNVAEDETLLYSIEEQAEIAMRLNNKGVVSFFYVDTGELVKVIELVENHDVSISSWAHHDVEKNIVALGLSNGRVLIFRHEYSSKYKNDKRTIEPSISYPLGQQPIDLEIGEQVLKSLAISENEDGLTLFVHTESGPRLVNYEKLSSFLDEDEVTLELTSQVHLPYVDSPIKALISPERDWLYLLNQKGAIAYYDIRTK
ncbi:MAG: hypothetical protein AAF304_09115, partial [Pseudomonadota bacterium]